MKLILLFTILSNHYKFAVTQISPIFSSSSTTLVDSTSVTPSTSTATPIVTPTAITTTAQPTTRACDSNPCKNNATCTNLEPVETNYICTCQNGWTNANCTEMTGSISTIFEFHSVTARNITITSASSDVIKALLLETSTEIFTVACLFVQSFVRAFLELPSNSTIRCERFFYGSVLVEVVLEFASSTPLNITEVRRSLTDVLKNYSTYLGLNFTATPVLNVGDFNECSQSSGYCVGVAICTNLIGGYLCSCPENYVLINQGTCICPDGSEIVDGRCRKSNSDSYLLKIIIPIVLVCLFLLILLLALRIYLTQKRPIREQLQSLSIYDIFLTGSSLRAKYTPQNHGNITT